MRKGMRESVEMAGWGVPFICREFTHAVKRFASAVFEIFQEFMVRVEVPA